MPTNAIHKLSKYACILCIAIMSFTSFVYYPRWNKGGGEATISWDVSGYYWYLPSIFIYHDLKHQSFKDSILRKYQPTGDFQQGFQQPNGNYVLKYSSGMAVMYLPFFAVAHMSAGLLGYQQDGFSTPYQLAIQLGALLMAAVGIWYLRKLMLRYYEDKVVAITLLILVIGTNYLNAGVIDGAMSHNWLFTLYVFLLLNTVHFYETFKTKYAIRIGLLIGLATLTRPTDALSALIPLLWGMEGLSITAIRQRIGLILTNIKPLLLAVVVAAVIASIQVIYWKYASGHWIVYSYQNQHLYFRSPNVADYTFSYRTGWLRYTPMMMLAFVGLVPFLMKGKNKVAITTFFLVNYYFICAWSIWWFGGRAMVQSYPVLMFPMASLISVALDKKVLAIVITPVVLFCAYMNLWFTHQCHWGGLYDTETMNKTYYNRVAGRWVVPASTVVLRDNTELYEDALNNVKVIYQNDFEHDSTNYIHSPAFSGRAFPDSTGRNVVRKMDAPVWANSYLELSEHTKDIVEFKFAAPPTHPQWLRMSADFKCRQREGDLWKMAQFVGRIYKGGVKQKENMFRVYRILGENETKNLSLDMDVSGLQYDSISIGFWNGGSDKVLVIDSLKVVGFDGTK